MNDAENSHWDGEDRRQFRHDSAPPHAPPTHGVKFDATINLGHVLTFVGFVIAGFTAWSTLDKRLTIIEERATFQAQIDRAQDAKLVESMTQIKESLLDIKGNINRLSERQSNVP